MFQNNLLMAADAATSGTSLVSVGNSALFNQDNSEYLSRTPAGAGNRDTWTFSTWVYRTQQAATDTLFTGGADSSNNTGLFIWDTGIQYLQSDSGSFTDNIVCAPYFRDIGWYHVVIAVDTTQGVETNRVIMYVNGAVLPLSSANYPAQNVDTDINSTSPHYIGAWYASSGHAADGYMAETVLIDGLQLTPTSFGVFDSTGLYWTPLDSDTIKALTFGTNGFYLDNTTNAETDASGNGNNFTNNNTVTLSTNTPTNTLATFNPLINLASASTDVLSNGNNTVSSNSNSYFTNAQTTLAFTSGKYIYAITPDAGAVDKGNGPLLTEARGNYPNDGNLGTWVGFICSGPVGSSTPTINMYERNPSGSATSTTLKTSTTVATNDKLVMAVDADAGKVWMGWYDTSATSFEWLPATAGGSVGDPADGSNPTHTWTPTGNPLVFGWSAWGVSAAAVGTCTMDTDDLADFMTVPAGFKSLSTSGIAANTPTTASDSKKYFDTILYEGNGGGQRVGAFQPFDNAFTVGNGALFNGTDQSLTKTFGSAGNQKTWTYSTWAKISKRGDFAFMATASYTTAFQTTSPAGEDNQLLFFLVSGASFPMYLRTSLNISDYSQWQHFMVVYDSTESTSTDRGKIYHNGVQLTTWAQTAVYPSLNLDSGWNGTVEQSIGKRDAGYYLNGYMAETVFIDGLALTPSSFGQTDTSTNRWIPKSVTGLTYGTNGFYLDFADSDNVGDDESGNANDWTNNNSVAQSTDSPTSNLATLNPNTSTVSPLSNGNRTVTSQSAGDNMNAVSTIPLSGKMYWEFQTSTLGINCGAGITTNISNFDDYVGGDPYETSWGWSFAGGQLYFDGYVASEAPATLANGVRGCFAYDADTGSLWTGQVSGTTITWDNSGNPETGANPVTSLVNTLQTWYPIISGRGSSVVTAHFASADWTGSTNRPASFNAVTQDNLASSDQFISAFSWIKNRDATDNHMLFDRVRGPYKDIHSNDMVDEVTNVETVQSFLAGGVQIGNDVEVNTANESYVLWNWMMEATGTGSSNTDGSINTTSTLVDETLGMSISTYVGTGNNATIGHGLGVKPGLILLKVLNIAGSAEWVCYHEALTTGYAIVLNNTYAQVHSLGYFNNTQPTSSVFTVGTSTYNNSSGDNHIAYSFRNSEFISIGSYEGNGNADGSFVPTVNSLGVPIQPVWAMTKSIDSTSNWDTYDNKRLGYNVENAQLWPNLTTAEATADNLDIVTGGLKMRIATDPNVAETYVYIAIGTPMIDTDGRIIAGR